MRCQIKTLAIGVITFAGMAAFSGVAMAGCTLSLSSDSKYNTCIGLNALNKNTTGNLNTAIGLYALYTNTTGTSNTANGVQSLSYNTTGGNNTASGLGSLSFNTTGSYNTASGATALYNSTTGGYNTAIGHAALINNTTGNYNIALGNTAGYNITTGINNIDIGSYGATGDTGTIRIGIQGTQTKSYLAGVYGVTATSGAAVLITSTGQLGTVSSSRRYKEDIQPMGDVSDRLMNLRPVTFRYKEADESGNKPVQYGLIAEDVDTAMPELVVRNADGSPETVAYHVLPSLLLNEYQKQHQELAETKADLSKAKSQIASMKADMDQIKQAMDRLMASLAPTTKLASAELDEALAVGLDDIRGAANMTDASQD